MSHIKKALCILSLLICYACPKDEATNSITISGAWALYPLVIRWQEEYAKYNPGITIEITAGGAGKGMNDVLAGLVDMAMVSRNLRKEEKERGALELAVARDAVLPTINQDNPVLKILTWRGVNKDELRKIWIEHKITNWKQLLIGQTNYDINLYTRADACGAGQVWAEFLGGTQEELAGIQINGDPALAEAVAKDRLGLGYNNIGFVFDAQTKKPVAGLAILKIDFNQNGKIDPDEDFYHSQSDVVDAIRDGRFPSPPARTLYFVTNGKPTKKVQLDFLIWILTTGQSFVEETGYIKLNEVILNEALAKIKH